MSDRETLVVALVVIYLLECVFWTRRDAVVFRAWFSKRWRLAEAPAFLSNARGGLHWANPLPALGSIFVARTAAISLSPDGALAYTSDCPHNGGRPLHTGKFFRFEDIHSTEAVEKKLLINGEIFWRSDSVHQPLALAGLLWELKELPPEQRIEYIRQALAQRFNSKVVQSKCNGFAERATPLRRLSATLFLSLFMFCPYTVWRFGWLPALWFLMAGLLLLTTSITVLFVKAHKDFYPKAGDDRFKLATLTLLAPLSAIRAVDALSRPLLENSHPAAAGIVLLSKSDFARFARRCWRDLKYPALPECPIIETAARETEKWFRTEQLAALEKMLAVENISLPELSAPPAPSDPSHSLYCPRCETQYTASAKTCPDCGGRALVRLSD